MQKFLYPEELPVAGERGRILDALRKNRVVIVRGDTGSGKTTQLPKMVMEAGCNRIACTQPRRIAAVTVAERVAQELGEPIGQTIGYQHRFGKCLSQDTRVKFMTDGVLLAETRGDPLLRAYDAIILDEAHERSLNIDFLLGILKRILARRRDLKLIVSSATMDTDRFAAFFGQAATITVAGRLFPIEIRYQPPTEDSDRDLPQEIVQAVETLPADADTLVFLSGERDIREAADALEHARHGADDIIPLLASLPAAEQRRAFQSSSRRRIILATNVAETSLTIPGIRAVIDSGVARVSRYLHRTQVQRLQIEPISQASAKQRTGRCGRVGPGICIRLYSEEDFLSREEFTIPEILRSSLAGVILTMLDLGLGDISRFPFLDPPQPTMITAGLRELLELGAIGRTERKVTDRVAGDDRNITLTKIGRQLARFPLEPRLARMLLAAADFAVLTRALPIVAAMATDDPRRRPLDEREKAAAAHAQFKVPNSDFLATLRLWEWWTVNSAALSQSKLRRLCRATYLSFPKMREWADTVKQLQRLAKAARLYSGDDCKSAASADDDARLHRALLTGLITRIGHFDTENHDYRGVHGLRFAIHPSSVLAKPPRQKSPTATKHSLGSPATNNLEWIVAGELVDTARLFARNAAVIDPDWIESAAKGIVKSHYHSPEWDGRSGFVRATEQVTLYGLVIVAARRCDYSRINPQLARELFIRRGLLDGDFPKAPSIVRHNCSVLDELRRHAEKLRDTSLFDEEALYHHFEEVLPPEINSAPALIRWLRHASPDELVAFRLELSHWLRRQQDTSGRFPDSLEIGRIRLRLTYRHTPDDPEHDGITCTVRRHEAGALRLWRSDWLVPGMLPEKLAWMLSVLPTAQRKVLYPLEDTVAGLLAKLKPGCEPLADAVVKTIYTEWGFRISPEAWQRARLPEHLRVRFEIRDDENGRILAAGRDLTSVLATVGVKDEAVHFDATKQEDHPLHTSWDFEDLPEKTSATRNGEWQLDHYPALHDEGEGVSIRLHANLASALRDHANGVTKLYQLALKEKLRSTFRVRTLPLGAQLYFKGLNYPIEQLKDDLLAGAIRAALVEGLAPIRSAAEFEHRLPARMSELVAVHAEMERLVATIFDSAQQLQQLLTTEGRIPEETVNAVLTQLAWLTPRGFPRSTPLEYLRYYPRYLKGALVRLERSRTNRSGDLAREERFATWWNRYREELMVKGSKRLPPETLLQFRWMLEEFRISLFAQELKTAYPVSEKRLEALLTRGASL